MTVVLYACISISMNYTKASKSLLVLVSMNELYLLHSTNASLDGWEQMVEKHICLPVSGI